MADKKDKRKKKKKKHRVFWFFIKLQIFLMLIVLGGFGYYYFGGYADEIQQLKREAVQEVADSDDKIFIPSQTCFVYDTNGDLISERKGQKDAQYVKYGDIPQSFVTATISIEDKKFYQHNGVDFKGVVRAAKGMVEAKLKKNTVNAGRCKYNYHAACKNHVHEAGQDVAVQGKADVPCDGAGEAVQQGKNSGILPE